MYYSIDDCTFGFTIMFFKKLLFYLPWYECDFYASYGHLYKGCNAVLLKHYQCN